MTRLHLGFLSLLSLLACACDGEGGARALAAERVLVQEECSGSVESAAVGASASGGDVRSLTWEDLVPETEPFDDPFAALEPDQLHWLSLFARVRTLEVENPAGVSDGMREEAATYEQRLREAGIDIEGLLARREEIRQRRAARAVAVVPALDGASIRMPGYLLPLEYEAEKVIEFLLVPWVGACIHTPPPPPNQIVHVRLEEAIDYPGYYEPIWTQGVLSTEGTAQDLYHVDGKAVVPTAYSMRQASVSPYGE